LAFNKSSRISDMNQTTIAEAPRVRRKQAERTALSDRKLTEAAIRLLVERGVQGTTLQAVGELAGYSRGLATHRFGSKGGLFAKVLEVASHDWLKRMQKAVGARTGVDALCAATDAAEKFMRERPDELTVMYLLWFLGIDRSAEYQSNIAKVHKAQRRDVAAWISAGQKAGTVPADAEPLRVAEQYAASMAGIIYQWLADPTIPVGLMFAELKDNLRTRLSMTPAKPSRNAGTRATKKTAAGRRATGNGRQQPGR
jgi:AcrR family transcriptional regulator